MATQAGGFDALLSAFDRFCKTLDATTVPADGGGRAVGGISHAVALSEATDALNGELYATMRRLFQQHGRPGAEYSPGVALMESDSPDGHWTPIPAGEVNTATMGIGGDGADATLLAALESATMVAAFPIDKWNAMQAIRPGENHRRFSKGEVVSSADLAVLESAKKLLHLKASDVGGAVDPGAGEFLPAARFKKRIAKLLRKAASPNRKTKKVAKRTIDGVPCYSRADAIAWWGPGCLEEKE